MFFTDIETNDKKTFQFIPYERSVYDIFYMEFTKSNEEFYLNLQKKITDDLKDDGIDITIHQGKYIYELNMNENIID